MRRGRGLIRWFTAHRPLTVIGLILVLKDILFGLGFIFGWESARQTTIYILISGTLNPIHLLNPVPLGILMILLSVFSAYALVTLNDKLIGLSSLPLAMVWIYIALILGIGGNWFLAFAIGFLFSVLPSYLGFALRNRHLWTNHTGLEWRDK